MANFHLIIDKNSFFDIDKKCKCGKSIVITIYADGHIKGLCGNCGTFHIYLEDNNNGQ